MIGEPGFDARSVQAVETHVEGPGDNETRRGVESYCPERLSRRDYTVPERIGINGPTLTNSTIHSIEQGAYLRVAIG